MNPISAPYNADTTPAFVAALAHEVRNPLANINLSVDMIKTGYTEVELKLYLDIIMRSSKRINDLMLELLKYHPDNEEPDENHSVHQLLDEVVKLAEDRLILKNIKVSKIYALQDCIAMFNDAKMKIALTNIVVNAIEAMASEKGELKLTTKSMEGKHIIEIEDNGCGINNMDMDHIFKAYFTKKPGGLGIGLATTYDILQSNNVEVQVESQEGKGTRFRLFFDANSY